MENKVLTGNTRLRTATVKTGLFKKKTVLVQQVEERCSGTYFSPTDATGRDLGRYYDNFVWRDATVEDFTLAETTMVSGDQAVSNSEED